MMYLDVLEVGTEVFVLSSQLFGVICSNDSEISSESLSDLNYYVLPNGANSNECMLCTNDDVVKVLSVGTKIQIKDTAFYGVILGDDRDLPVENLDGFNYFIGEEGNDENKLFVHYDDICLA